MKLHVVHRTTFHYPGAVTQNLNEVRLKPVSDGFQNCDSFQLNTQPASLPSSYLDFYFNWVEFFEISEPHRELVIEGISEVTTSATVLTLNSTSTPMSSLGQVIQSDRCHDFIQPTSLIALTPEIWRLALDATAGQSDIWQAAIAIMRFMHSELTYMPNTTNAQTPMLEALKAKQGVCQDFAHIMLGMCRSIRVPARYVSGYLYNGPTDQLLGTQASHAWCEIYLPECGWQGLDPTNNQPVDERYVKVAVGRDYSDAAPIKGHFRGPGGGNMNVEVRVERGF